jgi:sortase A
MLRRIIFAVVCVALALFVATLLRATVYAPGEETRAPVIASAFTTSTTTPQELPARLHIPAIGVDAHVQHVGVTAAGAMGVPDNYVDVAWYRYGAVPGRVGSAVIDGHVDNGLRLPGVFKKLDALRLGDELFVETANGERIRFVVEETQRYPYEEVPVERVFNRQDASRLVLIT